MLFRQWDLFSKINFGEYCLSLMSTQNSNWREKERKNVLLEKLFPYKFMIPL